MGAKRSGAFALVRTTTASGTDTPDIYVICESANITGEPVRYRRINNVSRDILGSENAGFNFEFTFDGAEFPAREAAYLWALALGGYTWNVDTHELTVADDSGWCEAFIDRGMDLGTSEPTQTAIGCKITSLAMTQERNQYTKFSGKAKVCDQGVAATLSASISPDVDDAPLSWRALKDGAFQSQVNDAVLAADTGIQTLKIEYNNDLTDAGLGLTTDQPTDFTEGERQIKVEYTREFTGANALAEYNAWKNGQEFGISALWTISASAYFQLVVPHIDIEGTPSGEIGTGSDPIMLTMAGTGFVGGSDDVITGEAQDDDAAALWT